jgi:hypothetical protein
LSADRTITVLTVPCFLRRLSDWFDGKEAVVQRDGGGSHSGAVVVGVDTHKAFHVAAVIDSVGVDDGSDDSGWV